VPLPLLFLAAHRRSLRHFIFTYMFLPRCESHHSPDRHSNWWISRGPDLPAERVEKRSAGHRTDDQRFACPPQIGRVPTRPLKVSCSPDCRRLSGRAAFEGRSRVAAWSTTASPPTCHLVNRTLTCQRALH